MTQRHGTEYAPLLDRYELVKTAILMIDEGAQYHAAQIMQENPDTDFRDLHKTMTQLLSESYINMLYTFVLDEDEARQMVTMLALENEQM